MRIPRGWTQISMEDLGEVQAGRQRNPNITEGELRPYLRVANVQDGWIDYSDIYEMPFSARELPIYELRQGDILLTEGQSLELVGRPAVYRGELPGCCFQNSLVRLRSSKHSPEFCYYVCYWLFINGAFRRVAKQTTSIAHLGVSRFAEIVALIPPLPEQRKIADILGTWDEALEKLDALLAAKERRQRALRQQLLTGRRRLKGFRKSWSKQRFGELMRSEDRYVTFEDDHLYHLVSARRRAEGVFFREALHGREIKTKVMKQVRAGDFVISRMQVVHGGLGVVPPECDGHYASDSYEVLVPRDPTILDPRFIGHLCRTRRFWHHALVCSHGVHIEKMTFVMEDFNHEKFLIPEISEQRAIADVLDTADAELRLLHRQREALDRQKRGLMQQLLTGRIRMCP